MVITEWGKESTHGESPSQRSETERDKKDCGRTGVQAFEDCKFWKCTKTERGKVFFFFFATK